MRIELLKEIYKSHAILVLFIFLFLQPTYSQNKTKTEKKYRVKYTKIPPSIDGDLSDPAWENASPAFHLTQQDPSSGAKATEETDVMIVYNNENIYFGIYCHDKSPDKIVVRTMQRDGPLDEDDEIRILLDTFHDKRNGYVFEVNPAGARRDGLAKGEYTDYSWDGIWYAKARKVNDGWIVEIKIPSRTISFKPDLDTWGLNVERRIKRKLETDRWSGTRADAHFSDPAEAGLLVGIGKLVQGKGLSVKPYMSIKSNWDKEKSPDRQNSHDEGFDIYKSLTSNLNAVFTYNTDFAETEVDARQINLTRFPLFFPEKRSFFLEGSGIFDFGLGTRRNFIPFFSRRIGLVNGEQVPIKAGVKLWGRMGNTNIGILDVKTDDCDIVSSQNLFVTRIKQNIWEQSYIGMILTNGDPKGKEDNTLAGVDFTYKTTHFRGDKNFVAGAWYTYSKNETASGSPSAWGLKVDYPNDFLDASLTFHSLGEGVHPALGFLPRPGVKFLSFGASIQPRPRKFGIRQMFFENYFTFYWTPDWRLETRRFFFAPINLITESGEHFEINYSPQYEYLAKPFEIFEGVTIKPGSYNFNRFRVEFNSASYRWWKVDFRVWFGEFYDGRLNQWETGFTFKPNAKLKITTSLENDFGKLSAGNFVERLFQMRISYSWTPDIQFQSFIQYDNVSENFGTNNRFRWTLTPGTDLFIVYNRGWYHLPGDFFSIVPVNDQFTIKFQYTWRP